MKKLEFKSPISLNKEIISELEDEKMSYIRGGDGSAGDGSEQEQGFMSIGSRCTQYDAPGNVCSSFTAFSVGLFCNGRNCNKDTPSP